MVMDTGIKVGDCMKTQLVTIHEGASVYAAAQMMAKRKMNSLLVKGKNGNIGGVVTATDIVRKAVAKRNMRARVSAIASAPLKGVQAGDDLVRAAKLMGDEGVKRLVVFRGENVVGVISMGDIIRISPSLYDLIAEQEHLK